MVGSFSRVRWAMRKAHLPVRANALVLDVGSGGCPYPRADVLLERHGDAWHRCGSPLVADRPLVFGDACRMPFRDRAFDFVVASHILEHVKRPEVLLSELQRVAPAGYIETPNVIFERFVPYPIHCLEVYALGSRLFIRKKGRPVEDLFLRRLALSTRADPWARLMYGHPEMFHVRFFWKDKIDFEVIDADESMAWYDDSRGEGAEEVSGNYGSTGWRSAGLRLLRAYWRRRRRKAINWLDILACPECHGGLEPRDGSYYCRLCRVGFSAMPVPDFSQKVEGASRRAGHGQEESGA